MIVAFTLPPRVTHTSAALDYQHALVYHVFRVNINPAMESAYDADYIIIGK